MTTTTQERTATEEINHKANETIARLEARFPELDAKIASAEQELARFPANREEWIHQLQSRHNAITSTQEALTKAEAYAKLCVGTLKEKNAIKTVSLAKKELERAQKQYEVSKLQITEADRLASEQEQRLQAQIAEWQAEVQSIQDELTSTKIARQQAHKELGEQVYTAIMDQFSARQAEIDKLKEQLVALQAEQHSFAEESLHRLGAWSDYRHKFRALHPAHDETIEVVQHATAYFESLLTNRTGLQYGDWWSLLALPVGELHFQEHLKQDPKSLRSRLASLEAWQKKYAESINTY